MAGDDGFIEHLKELFEPWGEVVFRRMFGGHGLFREGLMFALVADNTLYLKADDENRPGFDARGLGPFTYVSSRGEFSMSYYRAPEEAVDNSRDMTPWAHSAFSAAQRAAASKSGKKTAGKKAPGAKKPSSSKKTSKKVVKKKSKTVAVKKKVARKKKSSTKKAKAKPAGKKTTKKKTTAKKASRKKK